MKIKFSIGFIIGIVIVLTGIFFILPPRVTSIDPFNQTQGVDLSSSLIIKFDKPVKRQMLIHSIVPKVYGEWKFEDSLIKNHMFRTLVFTPAVDFKQNTQYQVKIENIISPPGVGLPGNFSFGFKTTAISSEKISQNETQSENSTEFQLSASLLAQTEPKITLLDIDLDWQDNRLSCEAASLKMALAGKGVYVSEDDIMEKIGYDSTQRQQDVWGDPFEAFVGDIDGKICDTGYGVHWGPVASAANNWREGEAFSDWNLKNLIKEITSGNLVIVWGTLPVETLRECSWYTLKGRYIKTFKETHVRLVVGFIGEAENPSEIILNDPLSGRLYWSTSYFLANWKAFGYSGVVIR